MECLHCCESDRKPIGNQTDPRSLAQKALSRISPYLPRAPMWIRDTFSGPGRGCVYCVEAFDTPSGSVKYRGALNVILQAPAGIRMVCGTVGPLGISLGEASISVSGPPVTSVVPEGTREETVRRLCSIGGEVFVHGKTILEAEARAEALSLEYGYHYVSTHDDLQMIVGAGTIMEEIRRWSHVHGVAPDVLCPVVSGGLLAGLCLSGGASMVGRIFGVEEISWPMVQTMVIHGKADPAKCGVRPDRGRYIPETSTAIRICRSRRASFQEVTSAECCQVTESLTESGLPADLEEASIACIAGARYLAEADPSSVIVAIMAGKHGG